MTTQKTIKVDYNHRILWWAAKSQMKVASVIEDARAREDKKIWDVLGGNEGFYYLSSLLLVIFAFEGFLNHLGGLLYPDYWDDKPFRKDFRKFRDIPANKAIKETAAKAMFLTDRMDMSVDWGTRPFQTIVELAVFRNRAVHSRTDTYDPHIPYPDIHEMPSQMMQQANRELAERAFKDIETASSLMNAHAKNMGCDVDDSPFEGVLGVSTIGMTEVERIMSTLVREEERLRKEYNIRNIYLFGSIVRGQLRADSDIDILVDYEETPGIFEFVRLQNELGQLLGRKVDLVTRGGLKPAIGELILEEALQLW